MLTARQLGIPTRTGCTCVNHYCLHHQAIRSQWDPYVRSGLVDCWRCGKRIRPTAPWDLGHDDDDRTLYRGPEHRAENRATSTRKKERDNRWIL